MSQHNLFKSIRDNMNWLEHVLAEYKNGSKDYLLDDVDREMVFGISHMLEPFAQALTSLEASYEVTTAFILPALAGLMTECESL